LFTAENGREKALEAGNPNCVLCDLCVSAVKTKRKPLAIRIGQRRINQSEKSEIQKRESMPQPADWTVT
jgi:hypothetical protein